ncbi:MAG: efflux RND transporter permease subunit, partial [Alphaproteobacteria bacterium]|nr:efflux RND transporter permease subunit [Alphaproteobacteria bacterium]
GLGLMEALREACRLRLRPILMTSFSFIFGVMPLIFASGAGSETRYAMGVVVLSGVLAATLFTLIVVPVAYALLARQTGSPQATSRRLEAEAGGQP